MKFSIYRYNPDADAKPYMQDYDVALEPSHKMLLDAILRIKVQDDSLSIRRSCREGVCGSDAMNINGRNGLACLTALDGLKEPIVLRYRLLIHPQPLEKAALEREWQTYSTEK